MKKMLKALDPHKYKYYLFFAKQALIEWIGKHAPLIPARKPKCPGKICPECGRPLDHIAAYNTGDGWLFFWECENSCGGNDSDIIDWYPFWFWRWCWSDDLEKIGIEVV